MTPRATMSTRVFETTFIITAIFSTPGLAEDELGELARLVHARVAADLAVVGGLAALLADRVEEREGAAARTDDEAQIAVELDDVAGDAAVIGGVHGLAPAISNSVGGTRLARLFVAGCRAPRGAPCARPAGLGLHVDVTVEHDEAPVLETRQRVDLGEREVVLGGRASASFEHDRRELVEVARAGDTGRADGLLGDARGDGQQRREVRLRDVVGVGLGDLLDVDATHVARRRRTGLLGGCRPR